MYQTIHEKIEVIGVYANARFTPKRFKWRDKIFQIQTITFIANVKDGGVRTRIYSVLADGTVYRICFNRDTEIWMLEELWYDG